MQPTRIIMTSHIYSKNGWDPLKEVIVGRANNANIPPYDASMQNFMYANLDPVAIKEFSGPYSEQVINEANQDLEKLCSVLRGLGVIVHRPEFVDHTETIRTPEWSTTGWHNYCPRDIFLVVGDNLVETPTVMRCRYFEHWGYHHIFEDMICKWFSAPKPRYRDNNFDFSDLSKPTLLDKEILFDGANIVRLNDDLLYQVSNSGNLQGVRWLQQMFPKHRVRPIYGYSGAHIDSTIMPLREGLVLFNADRVQPDNYPKFFEDWDKIFFNDFAPCGVDDGGISSNAIGMNLLSINPNLVIVDENQKSLIAELKRHEIESIPLPMRHARTLGGSFHCVTLDLRRQHG